LATAFSWRLAAMFFGDDVVDLKGQCRENAASKLGL
jgi:hypothetical protein